VRELIRFQKLEVTQTMCVSRDHTYIFMFDSLNGKHPGAMKNLGQYLRFEATDKKGIENPSSPETKAAHVRIDPGQYTLCAPSFDFTGSYSRQLL
jgi:hypothetical protein